MSGNMIPIAGENKKRICYFFDSDIGNYHYGPGHPMKPHRIRMTHALVMNYGLYKKMEIFRAKPATRKEMAQFHTDDYVDFLSKVTPDNMEEFSKEQTKFNLGDDCPVFDGLFEYCSISAGGSMEGAARLSRDKCDIAVNWAGGLHHAKKAEANGFCYVNDIVLGILELLRYHKRVLYVDIDVHHGDGVEEAFYTTDRVMTCSFHKYGEFFPGTGELRDTGHGKGKHYAVNFPLRDGITDEAYKNIFEPVIMKIMETYQPSAIVLQCGGDSLSGDRLGSFNVSMRGHANCVQFIKSLGLPLLLLGGGGYTIRNVSRTWAYETGLAAGQELCPDIPMNEYYEYFGPTYRLDVPPSNMEDMNVVKYLEKTKIQIFENLRHTIPVPSVGLQAIPRMLHDEMDVDDDLDDPNERKPQRLLEGLIQRDDEFSDSEDEGEGGRRDVQSHKRARRQSPKLNGNGILNIHSGIQNGISQSQHHNGMDFNRITSSHHSPISVDPIEPPPLVAPAPIPPLVDIPMLSQVDQMELEKLTSEALASMEPIQIQNVQQQLSQPPQIVLEEQPTLPTQSSDSNPTLQTTTIQETSKPTPTPIIEQSSQLIQTNISEPSQTIPQPDVVNPSPPHQPNLEDPFVLLKARLDELSSSVSASAAATATATGTGTATATVGDQPAPTTSASDHLELGTTFDNTSLNPNPS
ncbi:hypothetical protein Pst134EA_013816 [Puccinia striiformis f. sp. tritici]|uniref:hypothetical protein n=1 Tax=Puccinia striiformis f. sp. tritici TaxID=168172 RepID=UPI0020073095|nr:hypothetical protein Pst134EA_013816 [Puccinia striiformis f. sp. tritici]KAH9465962.1 hypothetical protein Pst134EA_013816 [Puccinia striiformis f. sp. tritici]